MCFFYVMNIINNWEIDVMLPHGPSWDSRSDPQRDAGLYFEKLEKLCVEKLVTLSEKKRKAEKDSSEYKKKARTDSKTLTNPKSHDSTTSSERRAQKRRRASVYTSLHTANPTRLYAQFLFNWNLLLPLGEYISHCHFLKHIFVLFFFLPVLGVSTRGKCFLVFCMQWFKSWMQSVCAPVTSTEK